jgi:hypothetical protein
MVGAMNAMPPSPAPTASALVPSGSGTAAATVHRFALAVTSESLQQRWHAVLQPEAAPVSAALEFSTPLDLLRHLAQLPTSAPEATAPPLPRTGAAGLR